MKHTIILLAALFALSGCCSKQPQVPESRLDHDLLTDIVTITNINYNKDGKPVVDLYITNPHNYELRVYSVENSEPEKP